MTRKSQLHPVSRNGVVWLQWKLFIFLYVALSLLSLLCIHLQYYSVTMLEPLSVAGSHIPPRKYPRDCPKVAFLFLTRRDLPLDFMWDRFFKGADQANFSVYIHSQPGFVFNEETTRSHYFYNRQLNNSINVIWGEYSMIEAERLLLSTAIDDHSNQRFVLLSDSMIEAERLLLSTAIDDHSNQRFVLLSDSCAPLYDFGYIYRYLISSPRSFVDSFMNTKERRYSMNMSSVIPEGKWRKGSQWISVIRSHAELIVNDGIVFPVFEKFCKKAPPFGSQEAPLFFRQNLRNCIPDEHYIQTLLTMRGLESEVEPRTLTYTVRNVSGTKHGAKSWHPVTFTFENSGPEDIQKIKRINHVNYESESRIEWCTADSKPVPCFLFARKFTNEAAMRLVIWGEYSMIEAERLLLSTAIDDHSNQRFVLLSDSCAPLYDFGYIYQYLISSPRSFVDSFINTKERRYSMNMSSVIPEEKWRKWSQWISVIRSHAELIVNDGIVFSAFEKFCKKAPPFGSQEAQLFFRQNLRNCIPDEHYIQTLLTMSGLENEMEPRTLTYTVWSVSGTKHEAKSWHPVTFTFENSGPEDIQEIKSINHVNYESESRTEWCTADSKPVPCFLFARKFTKEAAMHLVSEVLIGSSKKT
ncbi:hypothetical protein F2Q68_00042502 [Brassica cretica]|uniref:Core-2/I-branching beta-1,6-N-acetylglucosaminyltransferase family protein n=1 Tax=Brassica cretica TaxID=69181 RepID=A0A8S9MCZ3_BRACR|nr:hypothetical protein F2Q68_00042502 [Brassica cretica]